MDAVRPMAHLVDEGGDERDILVAVRAQRHRKRFERLTQQLQGCHEVEVGWLRHILTIL
jgi:hypothetical protein